MNTVVAFIITVHRPGAEIMPPPTATLGTFTDIFFFLHYTHLEYAVSADQSKDIEGFNPKILYPKIYLKQINDTRFPVFQGMLNTIMVFTS